MPELPEVEIVKRELESKILNQKIIDTFQSEKNLRMPIPKLKQLIGLSIKSISRRNKYIIIETDLQWCVIHLGMTGRLTLENNDNLKKHTHYFFKLDNNSFIKYEDARRFGVIAIYDKSEYPNKEKIPLLVNLGVEPFSDNFNASYIYNVMQNRNVATKKLLMDSNLICGVGNIYASEILFLCGINPSTLGKNLTKKDCENIRKHTIDVLSKSISLGGSSISDYVHTNGVKGEMQNFYNTYGRYGQQCKQCKSTIERINLGGRNSFFCPSCQPLVEE